MPSPDINPALVPTVNPGQMFSRFTEDTTLNIRWLVSQDPVLFEVLNRPIADVVVRQLIIAKAIDALQLRLSHQALFPFLITCKIQTGTHEVETPPSWIWDMHVSIPAKWELLRLAKVERISGSNGSGSSGSTGSDITGKLRLIFTAQEKGSNIEVALFYVDYQIDNVFTYQIVRVTPADTTIDPVSIDPGEAETINGFIYFRTLDRSVAENKDFLLSLAPPIVPVDSNSDGIFDNPAIYEVLSTPPGGITNPDDFIQGSLNHGTGIVVASAFNSIPIADSDVEAFLRAANFPFRVGATRTSIHGITIPGATFREFSIVVPAPDEATGDTSMRNSPVWLSSIQRLDSLATQLKFIFSTYTIQDDNPDVPKIVEFAVLVLNRTFLPGRVVDITPITDLLNAPEASAQDFIQGYGLGHVVLSSIWASSSAEITNFFDSFLALVDTDTTTFAKDSAILSWLSTDRSSRYIPTKGQFAALKGSTSRLLNPIFPNDSNRFVPEEDQGFGDAIDFRTKADFPDELRENPFIEPIGYTGGLLHRVVSLIIDASTDQLDYNRDLLPRLRCLLGRDPRFGDFWFDGTVLKFFTGDAWISL